MSSNPNRQVGSVATAEFCITAPTRETSERPQMQSHSQPEFVRSPKPKGRDAASHGGHEKQLQQSSDGGGGIHRSSEGVNQPRPSSSPSKPDSKLQYNREETSVPASPTRAGSHNQSELGLESSPLENGDPARIFLKYDVWNSDNLQYAAIPFEAVPKALAEIGLGEVLSKKGLWQWCVQNAVDGQFSSLLSYREFQKLCKVLRNKQGGKSKSKSGVAAAKGQEISNQDAPVV